MTKAIVFPGQGSQAVGMLADLYQSHPVVKDTFQEASDALGYDMWALVSEDADNKLNQTKAEYSPKLCPAKNVGFSPPVSK